MHAVDWAILATYLVFTLGVGFWLRKRASASPQEYFISGRKLPWWVLGTSMAATTFAADTPLAVTGLTAEHGISGNWLWWTAMFANITSAVVFAPLWRRSNLLTDVEFVELRYGGPEAKYLRGFLALYRGIVLNCIVMGWVLLAMGKMMKVFLGWEPIFSMTICLALVLVYALLSGLWGVVITDMFQFGIALFGSVMLALLSIRHVGGLGGLMEKLRDRAGPDGLRGILSPFPVTDSPFSTLAWSTFLVYLLILWWNKPEVEGTGYLAQRMMAARTEKDALWGTVWFVTATYVVRTWPWIVTALVAMVVFPDLADPEMGYPMMMMKVLPAGLLGLLVTSMVAAFMSTIDTQLNWGTSYLIHDLYGRFINRDASPRHYVRVAKLFEVGLAAITLILALNMESIAEVWKIFFSMTAGVGLVHLLRWVWWRVNVYTEITVMAASFAVTIVLQAVAELPFERQFILTCAISVGLALIATFMTRPTPIETRRKFLARVRPPAIFWGELGGGTVAWGDLFRILARWSLIAAAHVLCLLGPGYLLFGKPIIGSVLLVAGLGLFTALIIVLRRNPLLT